MIQYEQAVVHTGAGMQHLVEDGLSCKCVCDGRRHLHSSELVTECPEGGRNADL